MISILCFKSFFGMMWQFKFSFSKKRRFQVTMFLLIKKKFFIEVVCGISLNIQIHLHYFFRFQKLLDKKVQISPIFCHNFTLVPSKFSR